MCGLERGDCIVLTVAKRGRGGEGADQLLAAGADSQTVDTSAKTENNHNSLLKDKCSLCGEANVGLIIAAS